MAKSADDPVDADKQEQPPVATHARKRYEPPRIEREEEFEVMMAGCTPIPLDPGCTGKTDYS
jgi:hypothetical protein